MLNAKLAMMMNGSATILFFAMAVDAGLPQICCILKKLNQAILFCPCPVCGKDIVEGETREEFLEEIEDTYIPRYSVVVIYGNGTTRGFIVNADGRKQAMEKLFQKIDIGFVTSIHIAEILLEEDEF